MLAPDPTPRRRIRRALNNISGPGPRPTMDTSNPVKPVKADLTQQKSLSNTPKHHQNKPKDGGNKPKSGGGGKSGGGKNGGKNKRKSPYYQQAQHMVNNEIKPQINQINRYLDWIKHQRQQQIGNATLQGQKTQADLQDIFGAVGTFNQQQNADIANILSQSQNTLGASYDQAGANINDAYAKANEGAMATLQRLGITPVSDQMQQDQAWMTGLNEQNRTAAAQQLAAQQGIFAQAGGLLGSAIAGEQATQQGAASQATLAAITKARQDAGLQINDLMSQRKDIKGQRGSMINDAVQLLKQKAFEQMMEQAQLAATNQKAAQQMKLDWASLNETAQYHQGMLNHYAQGDALNKWKAAHDFMLKKAAQSGTKGTTRKDFMNGTLNGYKDGRQYLTYMLGKGDLDALSKIVPIIHSIEANWGSHEYDPSDPQGFYDSYNMAVKYLKQAGLTDSKYSRLIKDFMNIGIGKF